MILRVPPIIEMLVMTERTFVERYIVFDISHLIIDNKYTICYTNSLQNINSKLIFFGEFFFILGKELNIILLSIL